jgi:hypothetical protein
MLPSWLRYSLIGVLGLAVIVTGLLMFMSIPVDEVGQLLAEGGAKELREPMRPARDEGPRVIVFAIDGLGASEMCAAAANGQVPHMAAFLGTDDSLEATWRNAYAPRGVLSILPSTTYAAWTAVFTGEPVAVAGVSGNEWFDRTSMRFKAPAPVSGYGDAIRVYTEGLLDDWIAVPTLFERAGVRSYASLVAQHRGADLLIQPNPSALGELVVSFTAGIGQEEEVAPDPYRALDRQAADDLLAAIDEHGLADLTVVYIPGIDLFTHVAEDALSRQIDYLADVVDPIVGDVLSAFEARGALDDTYVVFVSDHGHTPARDTDLNALGAGGDDEWPHIIEDAGFRVRAFEQETDDDSFQAVLAYQGAFAYLYLADRSSCPDRGDRCDWLRAPRFEEDVVEAVRAIDAANRTGEPVATRGGTIDLIFARHPGGIREAAPFEVWDGERLVPVGEYLEANPRPDLLDLEERLEAMSTGPLGHFVGDVLLMSRYRFEDPIEQRFYFSRTYRSWHGSPSRQDSEIVFIVGRRGSSGEELRRLVGEAIGRDLPSQLDVTPLVLRLLGLE